MAVLGNLWIIILIVAFVPFWFPGNIMHVLAGEMSGIIIGNLSYVPDEDLEKSTLNDDGNLIIRVKEPAVPNSTPEIESNDSGNKGNNMTGDYSNQTQTTSTISDSSESTATIGNISYGKLTLSDLQSSGTQTHRTNTDYQSITNDYSNGQKNIAGGPTHVYTDLTQPVTDSFPNDIVTASAINTTTSLKEHKNTTINENHTTRTKEKDKNKKLSTVQGTSPYRVHSEQHRTPSLLNNHHKIPFRHHHLQLVPMEDEPFGAVILKDQRYIVSVMIPIGVGIIGAAIIIVTLYTLRYIARKNAREFHFPDLERSRAHTSCISSISSERTDRVVLLGGDEDDEF